MSVGSRLGRMLGACLFVFLFVSLWGCMVPKGRLNVCQTQNRALTEKNAALQTEVENLRTHQENLIRKLQQAEEELALVRQENQLIRRRLELKENPSAPADPAYLFGQPALTPESRLLLDQLAKRFTSLGLNPASGQCRLLSEGLFSPGQMQLAPEAEARLTSLAQLLQSSDAKDLRVWIVAPSDEGPSAVATGKASSDRSASLALQQAQTLRDKLCQMGVAGSRIGLATVGTPSLSGTLSGQNSSLSPPPVQVFLLPPEIPVVGWTLSRTGRY